MFKLGAVTVTKQGNYNQVKHYIANMVLIHKEKYLPSIRTMGEMLNINKSSVARAILHLYEVDRWLDKIQGDSPRSTLYKIIANEDQCTAYKNYYLSPAKRKAKFRKILKDAIQANPSGTTIKNKRGEVKDYWYWGSHAWNDAVKDIV